MKLEPAKLDPLSRASLHYAAQFLRGTDNVKVHPGGYSLTVDGKHETPSPLILMLAWASLQAVRNGVTREVFDECVEELRARQAGKREEKWLGRLHDDLLNNVDELKALVVQYSEIDSQNSNPVSGEI